MLDGPNPKLTLESLYGENKKLLFWAAKKILNDDHLAEDAVHTAWERIIKYGSINKFYDMPCNKISAFLVITVKNVAIDMQNKMAPTEIAAFSEEVDHHQDKAREGCLDYVLSEELFNQVSLALRQLPSNYGAILILRYFYDYSNQEIAELIHISTNNVGVRLNRGKQMLTDILNEKDMI